MIILSSVNCRFDKCLLCLQPYTSPHVYTMFKLASNYLIDLPKLKSIFFGRSTASSDDSTSNEDSGDDKDEAYFINKQLKKKVNIVCFDSFS